MSNEWLVEAQDALGNWFDIGRYSDNESAAAFAERYPYVRVRFDPEKPVTPLEKASASYEAGRLRDAQFAREQERKTERARLAKALMRDLVRSAHAPGEADPDAAFGPVDLARYAVQCADAILDALNAPHSARAATLREVLALFDAKGANLPTRDDVAALLEKP